MKILKRERKGLYNGLESAMREPRKDDQSLEPVLQRARP